MERNTMQAAEADRRTVNEIIRAEPETVEVFSRFGIDACCGGGAPVDEAARRHGLDPAEVWAELRKVFRRQELSGG